MRISSAARNSDVDGGYKCGWEFECGGDLEWNTVHLDAADVTRARIGFRVNLTRIRRRFNLPRKWAEFAVCPLPRTLFR